MDSKLIAASAAHHDTRGDELAALEQELGHILADVQSVLDRGEPHLAEITDQHRPSARNLLGYLALRGHDLRALQPRLTALGLSSLGRAEGQVVPAVRAVHAALQAMTRGGVKLDADTEPPAPDRLTTNTDALLGSPPQNRTARIMVTLPSEAATDYRVIHDLVQAGMDCVRINCAHDDADAWEAMVGHLRRANQELDRHCLLAMDLAGPKLRTGPVADGPAVMKIRPQRDVLGELIAPARVWLGSSRVLEPSLPEGTRVIPVSQAWLKRLDTGNKVKFVDARGARRRFTIVDAQETGAWAECSHTCYLVPGTELRRAGHKGASARTRVGPLPARPGSLHLRVGDLLVITRDERLGRDARRGSDGEVLAPATIGCSLPDVFNDTRVGERIWLDDGLIGGLLESVEATLVTVRIDRARAVGEKLRGDKGINLPDSALVLPALTAKDLQDLDFVACHADIVSMSFVNTAADVELLQRHLHERNGDGLGIVLKIETRRGFEALPDMLLVALRSSRCGVMIARGDLAVECGFERLAELQEEILWICESAHVPVIWATQVLESLARSGIPSRAEITDAAMSERAECVMLNKGPHTVDAVKVLDDILRRMQAHASKKRSMLRSLDLARRFLRDYP
jgi:pyruvate kinase